VARRKRLNAIADRGAHAVIPLRKNARLWRTFTVDVAALNEILPTAK
jgi:hypothetical protein